jgi:hypothetical protein
MNDARLVNHDDPDPAAWPPAWKVWANPIARRYCRSRLRVRGLGVWMLVVLLIAGFLFFAFRESSIHRAGMDLVDAERSPLIPLLILQGIIVFLLGTGQVAGGMTSEADEGVLEYQRLAPMSALSKVIGYLLGLPVREWILFLLTMPFSIWSLWRGQVPLAISVQVYGVFLTSAILYHLTGLVAGTVVKNRRWAFLVSMGVVFLLYTVIPNLANFGLVYFKYLTIMPVFEESYPYMIDRSAGAAVLAVQNLLPAARFFNLGFPQAVFTLFSQGALILTMIIMLWRRWRRTESHLLGKAWATGLFGWFQLVLLGNALPLIDPGYLFPSRGLNRFSRRFMNADWEPEAEEAIVMTGIYGVVTLVLMWILILMVTPNEDGRLRGWRRARKLGHRRLSPASDPATGFWWVILMVVIGATGWHVFSKAVVESHWFPGQELQWHAPWAFLLVMLTGGIGFHAILEGKGGRAAGLAVILLGIVPLMVGSIVAIINDDFATFAVWLIGLSPGVAPVYAAFVGTPSVELPADVLRAMPRAFWFWQLVGLLVTLRLVIGLGQSLRAVARRAADDGALPESAAGS